MLDRSDARGLRSIFADALEIDSLADRAAYLDEACGDDGELRLRIEQLLAEHGIVRRGFLGGGVSATQECVANGTVSERVGDVIGRYRLLEQIGEGGFGVVFMAEQGQPINRRVALKILKPGMDSQQVIARFEAERQALALMDHRGIASVFDAGTTSTGRPYFVMELVRGIPITDYSRQARLTVRQRLDLFLQVCRAVQHAHQKGVIHRDLKPTNVLVTEQDGAPMAKVIDFGVAKAIHGRLTERTLFTGFAQILGTPLYMSPEQASLSAVDVDTRADVYALGALLYEMLTGLTPFAKELFANAGYDEIRRVIREDEPPTPSKRISTSSDAGSGSPYSARELTEQLRGELDWIVMKALEKDRGRRYESASAFAEDVERYLTDQPVLACSPSTWYRVRKFARRNRAALAMASAFALALLVAVGAVAGSIGWSLGERSDRASWVTRDVEALIADVAALREEAVRRTETPTEWAMKIEAAESALVRGESLISGLEDALPPELVSRVRSLRRDIDADARDHRTVADIEAILLWSRGEQPDPSSFDDFRSVLARYAIVPGATPAEEAAQRVEQQGHAARTALLRGMVNWLAVAEALDHADAAWLASVLERAGRRRMERRTLTALLRRDSEAIEELAKEVEAAAQSRSITLLLADVLDDLGRDASYEALLRRAVERHPGDFWFNYLLGFALYRQGQPESEVFLKVAAYLRPERVIVHHHLALALTRRGYTADSIALVRSMASLITACAESRPDQYAVALRHAERIVEETPAVASAWRILGIARYRNGDFGGAAQALDRSIALGSGGECSDWLFLAMSRARLDQGDEARGWYGRAMAWLDENGRDDAELLRFEDEATAVLAAAGAIEER